MQGMYVHCLCDHVRTKDGPRGVSSSESDEAFAMAGEAIKIVGRGEV